MGKKLKGFLANTALVAASFAVCLLVAELFVFKYILVPDDVVPNVTINGVVRYQPNTRAIFRNPDGSEHLVNINADGWNSTKQVYKVERTPGVFRIAVVGDSYVQANAVDVRDGFAEYLESAFNKRGLPTEVYRFGIDGAPLSQYLHMLRREVLRYKPDLVLVQLIHNDFDESYRHLRGRYTSSYLKVATNAQGEIVELPPQPFKPGIADFMRKFRTFRYVYYETGLHVKVRRWVNSIWWGGNAHAIDENFISSAVDIRNIQELDKIRVYSRYVLTEMKSLAQRHGFKLAFGMDAVRDAIYSGRALTDYDVFQLNRIAAELMAELDLPFVDYQEVMTKTYKATGEHMEFPWDWHWNIAGNRIAAKALTDLSFSDPRLSIGKQLRLMSSAATPKALIVRQP